MLFERRRIAERFSELAERLQRLERDHAQLQARIEGHAALRVMIAQISAAARSAPILGSAVEAFATAMRRPLKLGRSGGLARARQASTLSERWPNGRFMSHGDWQSIEWKVAEDEYMRYAAGGFARAGGARRAADGTFLPRSEFERSMK
jgi:hypothetical protein